jgi:hypothetical protein
MPYNSTSGVLAIIVPKDEVVPIVERIAPIWTGLGQVSVGVFVLACEKTKVAIRVAKGVVVRVDLNTVVGYLSHQGVMLNLQCATLTMVVPSTWQLLLEDCAVTEAICALHSIVILRQELAVGPWLDVFNPGVSHQAFVQNLAEATSRTLVVNYFATRCGPVLSLHFGKLEDQRFAPWVLIEFASAAGLCNALALSGTPLLPHLPHLPCPGPPPTIFSDPSMRAGNKTFNGRVINVSRAKTVEEREAEVNAHTVAQCKHTGRINDAQARRACIAEKRDCNGEAIAAYSQQVESAMATYNPII